LAHRPVIAGLVFASALAGLALAQPIGGADPIGEVLQAPPAEPVSPELPPPAAIAPPAPIAPEPAVEAPVKAPPPKAEVKTPPGKRPRYPIAIVQAVDKVTAETMRFEAPVGKPVRYKNLVFTVRSCEGTASDESIRDAIANLQIVFQPPSSAGRPARAAQQVFRGWMFAATPSVSPLEHPIYDAWLIACKAASPPVAVSAAKAPSTPRAPASSPR